MAVQYPDSLQAEIDERLPELIATRRDFHEHPELAFEEVRTSNIVADRLRSLGIEVQTGVAKTGVVGLLRGQEAGKTLAIRADMDALPIFEETGLDFRSQIDGKMHACGHDGHTAILLTVADMLSKHREKLKGNIKFIFQPAEENIGGAAPMVAEGAMAGVDHVIGLHLFSTYKAGRVGVRAGAVFASANAIKFTVHGKGGHAAMPHMAIDPIVIAAHITLALQALISRESSPFSPAVITIGKIEAGTAFNIIPEKVEMLGTMRAFSTEHQEFLLKRIQEVASGIATSLGGSCDVEITMGCPPCINEAETTAVVHRAAVATVGKEFVDDGEEVVTTGSDDMGIFLSQAPGCYFLVGASPETIYPHHHPRFDINEESLPIAVEVLTRAAVDFRS
jgi:amidohydrolase